MATSSSTRRGKGRFVTLLVLVTLLVAGWSALWYYAVGKAESALDGWRTREARSGRDYVCTDRSIGGYPFRIEVDCDGASALFRGAHLPLELKARGLKVAAQIYDPTLLIGEFHGPLTVADPGQTPGVVINWKLAQTSLRGTPSAPERVALVFDKPVVERISGGTPQTVLRAAHVELHGRIAEGSAARDPVIEVALQLQGASADLHPALATPIDADVVARLRGLNDFAPKPWPQRFREIQAAGGRIDISQARVQQGETLAVGGGSLAINGNGKLDGQLRLTIAGLEPFLNAIGAPQLVQSSPTMDRIAGALDRFAPGLGNVARQQAGANVAAGINLIGDQTTLEGRRAVALPLRFDDGAVFLGPIKIGTVAALY